MRLKINDSEIIWPGRIKKKPEGFFIPTHLKVLTIEEKPFVYVRKLTEEEIECEEDEIPCPHFNVTNGNGEKSLNNQKFRHWNEGEHKKFVKIYSFLQTHTYTHILPYFPSYFYRFQLPHVDLFLLCLDERFLGYFSLILSVE